jgi:Cytidine and deoxycytidylate deaminase zinc-binding region
MPALDPEDAKLITLARAAQQRAYAPHTGLAEGAAVRDADGRTYAAATVEHADRRLTVSAVRNAIATAASSGARAFEAVAVVTPLDMVYADDMAVVGEFGHGIAVFVADLGGTLLRQFAVGEALGAPDVA